MQDLMGSLMTEQVKKILKIGQYLT